MKVTQDRQPGSLCERQSEVVRMPNTESERESGRQAEAGRKKRWADEITPAGLLALAARV